MRLGVSVATVIAIVVSLVACTTPPILTPNKKDYPCGYHGVNCSKEQGGGCCEENDICYGRTECEYGGVTMGAARGRYARKF